MINILYIGGYGRSGSSVLGLMLSTGKGFVDLGELSNLFIYKSLSDVVSFWENIGSVDDNLDFEKINSRATKILPCERNLKSYNQEWDRIFKELQLKLPGRVFIDSSKSSFKSFYRAKRLKDLNYNINFIHLIKDPIEVAKSYKKGSNNSYGNKLLIRRRGGVYRCLFSWFFVNLFTTWYYSIIFKSSYRKVTYDQIINDRVATLGSLDVFLNRANEFTCDDIIVPNTRAFSGNRLITKKVIKLEFKKNRRVQLNKLERMVVLTACLIYKVLTLDFKLSCW